MKKIFVTLLHGLRWVQIIQLLRFIHCKSYVTASSTYAFECSKMEDQVICAQIICFVWNKMWSFYFVYECLLYITKCIEYWHKISFFIPIYSIYILYIFCLLLKPILLVKHFQFIIHSIHSLLQFLHLW